ncbi:hypothetical protein [Streptomyces zaomyceticus]|uniref:hypothetical protein n=1 Tax=Streptomyces zaomyceticus TaxID=68286 RepID=UPI00369EA957
MLRPDTAPALGKQSEEQDSTLRWTGIHRSVVLSQDTELTKHLEVRRRRLPARRRRA